MTISNTLRTAGPFTGNGATVIFPFVFKVFQFSEVQVVTTATATGKSIQLVLNTDYVVSLNPDQNATPGGNVVLTAALPNGDKLVLTSAVDYLQPVDLTNAGGFYPAVINTALDRLTILCQQLFSTVSRTLRFPLSDTGSTTELPSAAVRANNLLGFDANGNVIAVAPASGSAAAVATQLANAIANYASTLGASLIGFVQAGTGAVLRTSQNKLRDIVHVADFGAMGDGTTDDSAALQAARLSLAAGGELRFGHGTYIVGNANALSFGVANITLAGEGSGTIIKAKNNAALATLVTSTAAGFTIRDMVVDGNRANAGLAAGSYMIYLGASNAKVRAVEVRFASAYAIFMGSTTATPSGLVVENCWIHDNGGITTNIGFGVGIYGGGAFLPDDIRIQNCKIENNFNTVSGFPGDSTATNITGTNIVFDGNFVKNNHNKGGGQVVMSSDGTAGASPGRHIVSNNTIVHTVIFPGESTCGVELASRKAIVTGNVIQALNGDGVRLEASGGDTVVSGNNIDCTSVGVNLISSTGVGIQKTLVNDNLILSAGTGIQVQPGPGNVMLVDNYIDATIPNRIVGDINCSLIRGNVGFFPATLTGLVAGASPYTFPILNYDAVYSCQVVNGMFSAALQGANVSILQYAPIFVKAGRSLTVAWSATAPTFALIPQQ